MAYIYDPLTNQGVRVTEDGRLASEAACVPQSHHVNHHDGQCYTLAISQQATAANDCIGYIKNASDDDLILEGFWLYSTTATLLTIKVGDTGTPNAPTAITPVNCNVGSGNQADGVFYKGADLDNAGANLAGGEEVVYMHTEASKSNVLNFPSTIIVPKNKTVTFYVSQNAAAVLLSIWMNFHSEDF